MPDFWGGYRSCPSGSSSGSRTRNRLHDRLSYRRAADNWVIERWSP